MGTGSCLRREEQKDEHDPDQGVERRRSGEAERRNENAQCAQIPRARYLTRPTGQKGINQIWQIIAVAAFQHCRRRNAGAA